MKVKVTNRNYGSWLIAFGFWLVFNNSAFSQDSSLPESRGANSFCSQQNLEILTTKLLSDLPSYVNRATQRARRLSRSSEFYSYMLVAGRPEFTPLPLNSESNNSNYSTQGVEQVFFTTLERQYVGEKAVELQQFHWLLLTKTKSGWRLVMMFSQTGLDSAKQLQSPPRDTSKSAIAQGVNTWLRDCQARSVGV
ncbi:hypothetical protein [Fortiea contorta]|uniref:hypothetical protein n=1 Tax=Fortiea contorta TaxID=1892405 RepID=UPI00037EB077|nr:hypothetical protein [Fortiea contorta]